MLLPVYGSLREFCFRILRNAWSSVVHAMRQLRSLRRRFSCRGAESDSLVQTVLSDHRDSPVAGQSDRRPCCTDRAGRRVSCRGAEAVSHGPDCCRTTESPQLLFDKMIDVPVVQVVQVRASSLAPCIWQSRVRCSVFAFGGQDYGNFWEVSVCHTPWFGSGYMYGVSL